LDDSEVIDLEKFEYTVDNQNNSREVNLVRTFSKEMGGLDYS
jgi:hypothetical protein